MKSLSLIVLLLLFVACGAPAKTYSRGAAPRGEEVRVKTEDKARQVAKNHLALKQRKWGKPGAVSERDGKYYVSFETPERERRLIGQRVLIVDKTSGVVTYQKRR